MERNGEIKRTTYKGLPCIVDSCGTLENISHDGPPINITLPKKTSVFGELITTLGSGVLTGNYNTVVIPGTVTEVKPLAFHGAHIKEIVWSSNCFTIPESCFRFSDIEKIKNIEHVKTVGKFAFAASLLKSIRWPDSCEHIPNDCFSYCESLKQIENIDSVKEVGAYAFYRSGISKIDWPSNCKVIPNSCFCGSKIEEVNNLSRVTSIETLAFKDAIRLSELDLSTHPFISIGYCAFENVPLERITPPYYMSPEELELF